MSFAVAHDFIMFAVTWYGAEINYFGGCPTCAATHDRGLFEREL